MANPYRWFSAAERVRIGTLASVSKWHNLIRPGHSSGRSGGVLLEGSRDGRGRGRKSKSALRSILIGKDCSK